MPRPIPIRSPRRSSAIVVIALAGILAMLPAGPVADVRAARPERGTLAVHVATPVDVGRASLRTLALRDAGAEAWVAAPRARLRWSRPPKGSTLEGGARSSEPTGASEMDPATSSLEPAATGGPGVLGPAWNGMTDQAVPCGSSRPCVEPADPWVAVSTTHVVQMVSQATRITDRSGGNTHQVSNRTFFNVPAWDRNAFVEYPRVLFDPGRGRWIATLFAGTCSAGALFVAVSATNDPNGYWERFYLPFAGRWPSYPTLGFSSSLVAIGVNEFPVSCGSGGSYVVGPYAGASLHVLDWADLTDGDATQAFASTAADPAAFTYAPAAGLTAGSAVHAVVALDDRSTDRADLGYVAIDGTVAGGLTVNAPVNLATAIGVAKLADPPTPVDAGGLIGVQGNALDLRPTDAVWRDGRLLVASTDRCARGSTTRPCGRVTELETRPDLGTPSLRQDLHLAPTAGYTDTFVPGVGYSDDGTIWTVFSQGGSGRYVSSWARRQVPGDAAGEWSPGTALIAPGQGPYGGTAGAGLNQRWGDYVGVARDPAEPGSAWQANQRADTGGGWATRVARLGDDTAPPVVGAPRPSFVKGITASTSSVKLQLGWTASDPGSGVATIAVQRSLDGGEWVTIASLAGSATTLTVAAPYGRRHAFRVVATDNAGNAAAPATGVSFTPAIVTERSAAVTYSGSWSTGRSKVYMGGRTKYTGTARRRATLSFTGLAVAWVASVGPIRGKARVYGDGVLQGTYDTHRSSTSHRRIVTGRTFGAVGAHTYRVEVVGTRRHPRVDVDAFIVLR